MFRFDDSITAYRVLAAGMVVSAIVTGIVLARSGTFGIDSERIDGLGTWLAEMAAILGFIAFSLLFNRFFMALLSPIGSMVTGEAGWLTLRTAGNACIAWIGIVLLCASTWSYFSLPLNVTSI